MIKDILGHTQISTTANVYGHVLPDIQRDATSRLDNLLGQPCQESVQVALDVQWGQGISSSRADTGKSTPEYQRTYSAVSSITHF